MANNLLKKLANYLGDYAPLKIDHKQYETEVLKQGADSGAALYEYCVEIIDEKFPAVEDIKILDLACGRGPFGEYAKKVNRNYVVDGIDIFVPEKQQLMDAKIYRNIIEADILNFDFSAIKAKYNLIVSNQFFEHLWPKNSIALLKKLSESKAAILISVPLSYQTFAYTKDYLLASLLENTEFSDLLSVVTGAEVHKTYFPKTLMKKLGFVALPNPVFHSNFFYRPAKLKPIDSNLNLEHYFTEVSEQAINTEWKNLISLYNPARPPLPKREDYEKQLIRAMLSEPAKYRAARKLIYLASNPIRKVKKLIT